MAQRVKMVMNMKEQMLPMISDRGLKCRPGRNSEKGAVLLVVVVLSAIALAVMTTLIYMITVGTQITGIEKRYRSAHDASFGGWEVMSQFLATRGSTTTMDTFRTSLNAADLSSAITGTTGCSAQTKMLTSSTSWPIACSQTTSIDTTDPTSYDFRVQFVSRSTGTVYGTYNVYGKIVNTVEGNTSNDTTSAGGQGLQATGTVNSTSGVITVMAVPYLYTVEVEAENAANTPERAKLSVLYQY